MSLENDDHPLLELSCYRISWMQGYNDGLNRRTYDDDHAACPDSYGIGFAAARETETDATFFRRINFYDNKR